MKWFTRSWWEYLLEKPKDPRYCSWYERIKCRMGGHKCGVWWHNLGGMEPDMHCKDCGDDLG
jgi:hypothetical protein